MRSCFLNLIHARQQEYDDAINASNDAGKSTVYIEFILSAIKASLIDAIYTSDEMRDEKWIRTLFVGSGLRSSWEYMSLL